MAGSRVDFVYTTDKGTNYYYNGDKSNLIAANGGIGVPTVNDDAIPRNITPRYCVYRSEDRLYSVKVVMINTTKFSEAPPSITNYAGKECKLQYRRPERRRPASVIDTALTNP